MKHFTLEGTILSPMSQFGDDTKAYIRALDKEQAQKRAERLIFLAELRSGIVISKWWYLKEMTLCVVL
jgi:hypothetical protein